MLLLRANLTSYQLYRLLVVLDLVRIAISLQTDPLGVQFDRARCLFDHGVSGLGEESNVFLLRFHVLHDWRLCDFRLERLRTEHRRRSDQVNLHEDVERRRVQGGHDKIDGGVRGSHQ